jgi:hypothetical protein
MRANVAARSLLCKEPVPALPIASAAASAPVPQRKENHPRTAEIRMHLQILLSTEHIVHVGVALGRTMKRLIQTSHWILRIKELLSPKKECLMRAIDAQGPNSAFTT